jgi:FkbM family methyltransferase
MTIFDIGANIGYFSLISGRQVGEKGKVFAFEPAPKNFSLIRMNIEVNGFSNIIPVAKAVSNCSGKQKLFLASDPGEHSLSDYVGTEFIEVDVTSVDEFVRSQNLSVDLIKMDVEGSEMRVLEGMAETIAKNPYLKIITEFSPHHLESRGCVPAAFLERLMGYGFKLHVIDEKSNRQELRTPDNMNDILKTCRRRGGCVNIFCDRSA